VILMSTRDLSEPDSYALLLLLVAAALSSRRVLRLKGGDRSIFGHSMEELTALRQAGVPVHVCPGITPRAPPARRPACRSGCAGSPGVCSSSPRTAAEAPPSISTERPWRTRTPRSPSI